MLFTFCLAGYHWYFIIVNLKCIIVILDFISAIAFTILARGEPESWARDDVHDEKVNQDGEVNKELVSMNGNGITHRDPVA